MGIPKHAGTGLISILTHTMNIRSRHGFSVGLRRTCQLVIYLWLLFHSPCAWGQGAGRTLPGQQGSPGTFEPVTRESPTPTPRPIVASEESAALLRQLAPFWKKVLQLILLGIVVVVALMAWTILGWKRRWGPGAVLSSAWGLLTGPRAPTDWPADPELYRKWFGGEPALWLSLRKDGRVRSAGGPLASRLTLIGQRLGDLAADGLAPKLTTAFKQAVRERRPQRVEFSLHTADGRRLPVSGAVGRNAAVFRDVSAEQALPATLAWASLLGGQQPGALLIENASREIVHLNEEACRLFGVATADEWTGRASAALIRARPVPPDDERWREKFVGQLEGIIARGQPVDDRRVDPAEATEWMCDYRALPAAGLHVWTFRAHSAPPRPGPPAGQPKVAPAPPPVVQPARWQEKPPEGPWCPDDVRAHLPPGIADTLYKNGYVLPDQSVVGWRLLGATRRGRLHAHHGTHREDAFHWRTGEDFTVAAVSDGAGSSALSRLGSETACRVVTAFLDERLTACHGEWSALPEAELAAKVGDAMQEAVRAACQALQDAAAGSGHALEEFRCTLLLAVLCARPDGTGRLLVSQVGDGCIGLLRADGRADRLAEPDSGEFSGQVTCFLPEADAVNRAGRIHQVPLAEAEALMLCSDGIEDPFFPIDRRLPDLFRQMYAGVTGPLDGFDRQPDHGPVIGAGAEADALEEWMKFEKRGENDDRTILLLYREPARLPADHIVPVARPAAGSAPLP